MALMAAHGEIGPMPDCAIFADTQWEPRAVYEHLKWLMSGVLPFPVHAVTKGDIRQNLLNSTTTSHRGRFAVAPWYFRNPDGSQGMGRRQCTKEFKIEPLAKKQRELAGYKPRQRMPQGCIEVWIGISLDEVIRAKPPRNKWQTNRWPLLEKRMNRWDCLQWLRRNGYPEPPKSSCIGCPYHSNAHWRSMKDNQPEEFADATEVDRAIRNAFSLRGQQFMHRDLVPLAEVDLSNAEDHGQLNLFNNECEGMCGV